MQVHPRSLKVLGPSCSRAALTKHTHQHNITQPVGFGCASSHDVGAIDYPTRLTVEATVLCLFEKMCANTCKDSNLHLWFSNLGVLMPFQNAKGLPIVLNIRTGSAT